MRKKDSDARLKRYPCEGFLVVRIILPSEQQLLGTEGNADDAQDTEVSYVQLGYQHRHIHLAPTQISVPESVKQYIREHEHETAAQIQKALLLRKDILSEMPNVTPQQIYNWWRKLGQVSWNFEDDEFQSAMQGLERQRHRGYELVAELTAPGISLAFLTPFFRDPRVDIGTSKSYILSYIY